MLFSDAVKQLSPSFHVEFKDFQSFTTFVDRPFLNDLIISHFSSWQEIYSWVFQQSLIFNDSDGIKRIVLWMATEKMKNRDDYRKKIKLNNYFWVY